MIPVLVMVSKPFNPSFYQAIINTPLSKYLLSVGVGAVFRSWYQQLRLQVNKFNHQPSQSSYFFKFTRDNIIHVFLKQRAHDIFNSSANRFASILLDLINDPSCL
jgi:hypothetical protein